MSAPPVSAEAIGLVQLAAMAGSLGVEAASPLADVPYLFLHLAGSAGRVGAQEEALLARWLRRQPCPVLAIVDADASGPLREACDVVVADVASLDAVFENIRRSPLAAMVLAQVLRATEPMAVEPALVVESLAFATLQAGPEFRRWLEQRRPRAEPCGRDPGPAVELERRGDHLDIRLNRPARRNALSVDMRDELYEALQLVAADTSIDQAEISGNGGCFSSGGDLDEFGTARDAATAHAIRSLRLPAVMLNECAGRVVFRLHGACIGAGVEMAAFGKSVRASRDAFFQLPEIRMGLIPGAGGCVSIPRRIGRQRAAYMALSAERIDAPTALAWGLVDAIDD